LRVDLRLEDGKLSATGALVELDGASAGIRRLSGDPNACRELADGMALAISLALSAALGETKAKEPAGSPIEEPAEPSNPAGAATPAPAPTVSLVARPPGATQAPPVESAPKREPVTADDAATPRSPRELELGAGVAVHATAGVGPRMGVGGALVAFGRRAPWSVFLEARLDGFSTAPFETGGSVTTSLVAGVVAPCRHAGLLAACVVGLAGRIRAESEGIAAPDADSAPYVALGGRLLLGWPLSGTWLLQGRVDGLVTALPVDIELDGETVWSSPPFSVAAGAGLLGMFP
jgi:hypothetical protein